MILAMSLSDIVRRLVLPKAAPEPEQLTIAHAGDTLPVTFLRSARARRASLRVDSARRRIVLTAPLRMARSTAVDFAHAQAGWIAARLKRLPAHRPFADGAEVPLFGAPAAWATASSPRRRPSSTTCTRASPATSRSPSSTG